MNRSYMSFLMSGLVLVSGLVSCSPEKKPAAAKDVYDPGPVLLVNASGSIALTRDGAPKLAEVDLHDSFDYSGEPPFKVSVFAQCDRVTSQRTFEKPGPLKVLELLPEEVLAREFEKSASTCNFEFSLINEVGSRYIFNLRSVRIRDTGRSEVRVSRGRDSVTEVKTDALKGVQARFDNKEKVKARLICEDADFNEIGFDQTLELDHINIDTPTLREGRTESALQLRRKQPCRVAISGEQGRITAISGPLTIEFLRQIFLVNPLPLNPEQADFTAFKAGQKVLVSSLEIENPESFARWVSVPAPFVNPHVNVYMDLRGQTVYTAFTMVGSLQPTSTSQPKTVAGKKVFEIGPKQKIRVDYHNGFPGPFFCRMTYPDNQYLTLMAIDITPGLEVYGEEIDETGAVLGKVIMLPKVTRIIRSGPGFLLNRSYEHPGGMCGWH